MKKPPLLILWKYLKEVVQNKENVFFYIIFFIVFLFIFPQVVLAFGECTSDNGNAGSCHSYCGGSDIPEGQGSCWWPGICCVVRSAATAPTPTPIPPTLAPPRMQSTPTTTSSRPICADRGDDAYCKQQHHQSDSYCLASSVSGRRFDDGCSIGQYTPTSTPVLRATSTPAPTAANSCTYLQENFCKGQCGSKSYISCSKDSSGQPKCECRRSANAFCRDDSDCETAHGQGSTCGNGNNSDYGDNCIAAPITNSCPNTIANIQNCITQSCNAYDNCTTGPNPSQCAQTISNGCKRLYDKNSTCTSSYGQLTSCAGSTKGKTEPEKECTPGNYIRTCTGKCGGCAGNAGEQDVFQCNSQGQWGHVSGECSTACAPACSANLPPDDQRPEYNHTCSAGTTLRMCTGACGGCAGNAGEEIVQMLNNDGKACTVEKQYTQCSTTCNGACNGGVPNTQTRTTTPNGITTSAPSKGSTASGGGTTSSGGGNSNGGGSSSGGSNACPASGDNCVYSDETGACYSGHTDGKGGFNVEGCTYSCGPVDCPIASSTTTTNSPTKPSSKEYIDCNPGDPVNSFDNLSCPDGKKGTCGGHSYCVWSENGNYESDPQCETANDTCSDSNTSNGSNNNESGNSCKDNPTDPPDGYTWKNSCNSCNSNDDCPQNTSDDAVSPETSNWCYSGSCLMLVSGSKSSKSTSNKDNKSKNKEKDKKKKSGKDVNDGKTKDDTGNRNKSNNSNDKSARDKAQKPIDKINKDRLAHGLPTLTPLPPDNGAYEAYLSSTPTQNPTSTPTVPTPTPQPPLAEPANWKAFCGATTNANKPYGMQLSWDSVKGAPRYAVRIDADAPSWEGDTPSPGDIVDNNVTNTVYVAQATPGAVYQWWVHSINEGGVYSALTHKMTLKCPDTSSNTTTPTQGANTVGAGQLIVLP